MGNSAEQLIEFARQYLRRATLGEEGWPWAWLATFDGRPGAPRGER